MLAASADDAAALSPSVEQQEDKPEGSRGSRESTSNVNEEADCVPRGTGIISQRAVMADWSFNSGEQIHALETGRLDASAPREHCIANRNSQSQANQIKTQI